MHHPQTSFKFNLSKFQYKFIVILRELAIKQRTKTTLISREITYMQRSVRNLT